MAADNHNIFKFVFVFNTLDGFYICKINYIKSSFREKAL